MKNKGLIIGIVAIVVILIIIYFVYKSSQTTTNIKSGTTQQQTSLLGSLLGLFGSHGTGTNASSGGNWFTNLFGWGGNNTGTGNSGNGNPPPPSSPYSNLPGIGCPNPSNTDSLGNPCPSNCNNGCQEGIQGLDCNGNPSGWC